MNKARLNMPSCVEQYKLTWLDPLDANYIYSKSQK